MEYRILSETESDDRRQGWLSELTWSLMEHFRIGAGYNFTDFSDDLTKLDYELGGWFVNFVTKY